MDAQKDVQLKSKRDEEEREKRLRRFNMSWIKDALWGFAMPPMMDLELAQRAVIRGIRYNDGFASELHGTDAQFTRALNAQAIMNNRIPDMHEPDEFPYCIWHPKIPTKDTCQELLHRYPQLNYQIGRVCAVAGYTDVYHSLALLPEVHIAEEARDANNLDIYNVITAQPAKYAVFDDYSRTYTPSSPRPSLINGDTCVRSMLEIKQRYSMPHHVNSNVPWYRRRGFSNRRFDITEDMSIDTYHSDAHKIDQAVVIPLLYNPLPADLPTVQKDLLILTAAVHGDIDRYARLRRPYVSTKEVACLARGIYHNPMFAKWVALQLEAGDERFNTQRVKKALHARFIMSNNLERITSDTPEADLPYLIWYPHLAERETYVELARKRPDVRIQAARACLVANYEDAYRDIDPPWDRALAREADESPNPFFAEDLRRKAAAAGVEYQGCNWRDAGEGYIEPWKFFTLQKDTWTHGHTSSKPLGRIELSAVENDMGYFGLYDGEQADVRSIEATVFASAEAREKEREALEEIEEQWPRHTRYPK
ncbi:hypothetical protein N0V86_005597 [Didymella sp. IMI 355093]|nr:hypothetical protein N0V86_005597 [Didymella sp. IMI 355093]